MSSIGKKLKRLLAGLFIAAVLTLVLLEGASWLLFESLAGVAYEPAALRPAFAARLDELSGSANGERQQGFFLLHPYVGYVGRPGAYYPFVDTEFNTFGMASAEGLPYPYRRQGDELVVAVLGGSVAEQFANEAGAAMRDALRELSPAAGEREVVLIPLATGGFKQPQQLFHLQFALLSGFQFDVVLNLDGFNELVFAVGNAQKGINPVFPSSYHASQIQRPLEASYDRESLRAFGGIHAAMQREERALARVQGSPLRHSATANLLAALTSRRERERVEILKAELAQAAQAAPVDQFRGPPFRTDVNPFQLASRIWLLSSQMLHATCDRFGIPYLHVLQPNQYVSGSKQLTDRELQNAFAPQGLWAQRARQGYDYLKRQGAKLAASGVAFHDLTMVFADVPGDLYVDDCCHFNRAGNEILARSIAPLIAGAIER